MKLYTIKCSDMGVKECNFMAEGKTKEEAMKKLMEHGMEAHQKQMEQKMKQHTKQELDDMMMSKMKEEEM